MKRCRNAKKYKGLKPPRCDGYRGCDACREIFQKVCPHPAEALKVQLEDRKIFCTQCEKEITGEVDLSFVLERLIQVAQQVQQNKWSIEQLQDG